ncbi:MAG: tetratricopeptide repeat protein [Bacteroidota bacterium]
MTKFNLVVFLLLVITQYTAFSQSAAIDSLRQLQANSPDDSLRFEYYFEICRLALPKADSTQQESYADTLQSMADEQEPTFFQARVLAFKAMTYRKQGRILEQRAALQEAKELYQEIGDQEQLADTEHAMARTFLPEGDYESAFSGYERALQIYRQLGLKVQLANSLNALGVVQRRAGNFDSAIEYLSEAAAASRKLNDKGGEATALLNQAVIHKTRKEYDLALPLYERGLELAAGPPKDEGLAAYIHNNLSALYFDQDKFELALAEGEKAYDYFSKNGRQRELVTINMGIASNLMGLKRYSEAIPRFQEVLQASKSELMIQMEAHDGLANCFAGTNLLDSALYHMVQSKKLQQELADESRLQALAEVEGRYQNKEKQAQIELLAAEDERKALAISRRNWSLAISGLVLLIVLGLLRSVMQQRTQIAEQKEVIQKALGEKEMLLKEIHHRVKNNLQMVSSLLNLQSRHLTDSKAVDALQLGKSRVRSMALIHQQLYTDKEVSTLANAKFYLEKLSQEIINTYQRDDQQIALQQEIADIDLDIDTLIPMGLLVNEALTNAVKYAFAEGAKGELQVRLSKEQENMLLSIEDNGRGMKEVTTNGTRFGSMLMQTLAEQLGGELERRSTEQGTRLFVEFPLKESEQQ